jgi:hypothetical protein
VARTFLIASWDHPDTQEGRPSTVRVGAVRSFMIAISDRPDIYRARRGGAPDDAGARCRALAPAGRRAATARDEQRPSTRGGPISASLRTAARRYRPWGRCPTGPGQRRNHGLWRKPFIFFNKLYKASADFFASSCKELEILTAWLKGQVARARWRQTSRGSQRGSASPRSPTTKAARICGLVGSA